MLNGICYDCDDSSVETLEGAQYECRHARAWRDMYIVWDTWMIGAIKRGVYRGDEADHLVPECDDPSYKEFLLINPCGSPPCHSVQQLDCP